MNRALLFAFVSLEENGFAFCLDFGGSDERDTGGVARFGGNELLRPKGEDFGVPAEDRVVIDFASGGDFLLEVVVLLHRIGDGALRLEFGIVLERDVDGFLDVTEAFG